MAACSDVSWNDMTAGSDPTGKTLGPYRHFVAP
jgi:hypothetical protein